MTTTVKYIGTALPTDSDTFTLFDTTSTGHWTGMLAHTQTCRVLVDIKHSHNGTLKSYKSKDGGTNWVAMSSQAVTASAATSAADYLVEGLRDFKLEWVNGGTTQTTFVADIVLSSDRALAI